MQRDEQQRECQRHHQQRNQKGAVKRRSAEPQHRGRPHSEPVTSGGNVNAAPIGAAALAGTSARGCRHTSVPSAARLMTPQTNIDSHALGTWMNMILTVAPCW